MKYKSFFIVAGLILTSIVSHAQSVGNLYQLESPYQRYTHNLLTVRWAGSAPLGSITDGYVDKASYKNYAITLEWIFRDMPLSAGIGTGKYQFEQRYPRAIYTLGENEVSAVKTSTFSAVPLNGFLKYHFLGTNTQFSPYVQATLGAHFNNYIDYYGTLGDQKKQTTFAYGGAVGLKFFVKKDGPWGIDAAIHYDKNTFKYGYITDGVGTLSGTIGIFYRWW